MRTSTIPGHSGIVEMDPSSPRLGHRRMAMARASRGVALLALLTLAPAGCELVAGTKSRKVGTAGTAGSGGSGTGGTVGLDAGPGTGGGAGTDGSAVGDGPLPSADLGTGGVAGAGGVAGTGGTTATGGTLVADAGRDLLADAAPPGDGPGAPDLAGTDGLIATGGVAVGGAGSGGVAGAGGTAGAGGASTGGVPGSGGEPTSDAAIPADSTSADATPQDAAPDALQRCNLATPFGTPVALVELTPSGTRSTQGRLTTDELTIYFNSDRSGTSHLYAATRLTRNDSFGAAQPLTAVNTSTGEGWPSVTADRLTLFFESSPAGTPEIFSAGRTSLSEQFQAGSMLDNLGQFTAHPMVVPDESALYFASTRDGVGGYDLYRAAGAGNGQFATPVLVTTVNTTAAELAPVISPDELVLYFASDRSDAPAKGYDDIWMTKRTSKTANFDPPVNVQELNTSDFEEPEWLSPDYCRLYLGRGNYIWVATRSM